MAQSLHEAAVAGDDVGEVIDEVRSIAGLRHPFGERHADRGRKALSERAGGRLDARRVPVFRVAGGLRAPLTEALEILDLHAARPGQVEQGVEQHRAVARRKDEAVAVGPRRVGGVELEEAGEEHCRDIGHAHRHAGMAGLRAFDGVDREEADGVRHFGMRGLGRRGELGVVQGIERGVGHGARLFWSISFRIIGVRISCMARSSLAPSMTMELARDMKLPGIIASR